jgi:hypothetical protein
MGRRTWVDSDIWSDTDGLDDKETLFFLYLLTNGQRNIAGYYKVNLRYMAIDMRTTEEEIERLLMKDTKYWAYDKATKQVLIPKFTRFNIVKSKQQFAKMNAELTMLKPCKLHKMFLKAFVEVNGIGADEMIDPKFKLKSEIT